VGYDNEHIYLKYLSFGLRRLKELKEAGIIWATRVTRQEDGHVFRRVCRWGTAHQSQQQDIKRRTF
jgi:hypothetical protein